MLFFFKFFAVSLYIVFFNCLLVGLLAITKDILSFDVSGELLSVNLVQLMMLNTTNSSSAVEEYVKL